MLASQALLNSTTPLRILTAAAFFFTCSQDDQDPAN